MRRLLIVVLMISLMTGCSNKEETLVIAEQYGLAYAPIQIAKELGYFEENLPDNISLEYTKLANTAAIREAMLAGQLDVGFMGIPPFLIGQDNGMDWKIMTGLSGSPLGLVVNNEAVTEAKDLIGLGKIALPQPGSIQHILLSMYAKNTYGDAKIFDDHLVAMKHPDGFQALMNDASVPAHFTSPPYLFQELNEPSNRLLVSGEDAVGGPFTFIVGVCREDLASNSKVYQGINDGLAKAIDFMETNPEETIRILAEVYALDLETMEDYLYMRGMRYETDIKGLDQFIQFMVDEAYIKKAVTEEEMRW